MKRERVEQGYHEDEAWNQQVARLDALKAQLRRKGVEDILKTIPAKLESVQEASMAIEVDKPSKRLSQELESLVEISTNICLWLSLSLPCIHEGDFAEDLIHQILATFKALTSSAKRLSSAIV